MLFSWDSEYLERYGSGRIIILADTAHEARQKALSFFDAYDKEHYEWSYLDTNSNDLNEIEERKNTLKKDIEKPPSTEEVLFITGSE